MWPCMADCIMSLSCRALVAHRPPPACARPPARPLLHTPSQLAESSARFLRPHLIPLVDAMMRVAGAGDSLEPQTRQLAVEFLVSLCEAREQSPGMMRKVGRRGGREGGEEGGACRNSAQTELKPRQKEGGKRGGRGGEG